MNWKFFDIPPGRRPFLRHPRTQQERNRNGRPEEKQYVRGKRLPRRVPNAWDDIPVRCWRKNVSWKSLRKQQYK